MHQPQRKTFGIFDRFESDFKICSCGFRVQSAQCGFCTRPSSGLIFDVPVAVLACDLVCAPKLVQNHCTVQNGDIPNDNDGREPNRELSDTIPRNPWHAPAFSIVVVECFANLNGVLCGDDDTARSLRAPAVILCLGELVKESRGNGAWDWLNESDDDDEWKLSAPLRPPDGHSWWNFRRQRWQTSGRFGSMRARNACGKLASGDDMTVIADSVKAV